MEEIFNIIQEEETRQLKTINLIASENFTSKKVRKALKSCLTNKYAEGYPSKRYYSGCENVDKIENLAIESAKKLFGVKYANVQPFSGSHANMIVYRSLLEKGDTVLGLYLNLGGHLTHGSKVNFSGQDYNFISYGLDENNFVNYEEIEKLSEMHKPKMIVCGGSSYSRDWDYIKIREICSKYNSYLFADISHTSGLIVSGLLNNPVNYVDIISTTTHKTLRGPRGAIILIPSRNDIFEKIQKTTFPGCSGGPSMNTIAAKAVCFLEAMREEFIEYSKQTIINSKLMADMFMKLGYKIVSGGTDNHLFVIDLTEKKITGIKAQNILESHGIYVNRNVVPNDINSPFVTSGIRIGLSFMTTLGLKEDGVIEIVNKIHSILTEQN